MTDWNDDEYAYEAASASYLAREVDEDRDGIAEMMDWAEYQASIKHSRQTEGSVFNQYGKLWVISVEGGQPIHHDRHMEGENAQHTWNIVCDGEGDQMLVTEVAQDMFNHMPIKRGGFIYLNTLNRHLVSRNHGAERCVLLQCQGFRPDQGEEALKFMLAQWRNIIGERMTA